MPNFPKYIDVYWFQL